MAVYVFKSIVIIFIITEEECSELEPGSVVPEFQGFWPEDGFIFPGDLGEGIVQPLNWGVYWVSMLLKWVISRVLTDWAKLREFTISDAHSVKKLLQSLKQWSPIERIRFIAAEVWWETEEEGRISSLSALCVEWVQWPESGYWKVRINYLEENSIYKVKEPLIMRALKYISRWWEAWSMQSW